MTTPATVTLVPTGRCRASPIARVVTGGRRGRGGWRRGGARAGSWRRRRGWSRRRGRGWSRRRRRRRGDGDLAGKGRVEPVPSQAGPAGVALTQRAGCRDRVAGLDVGASKGRIGRDDPERPAAIVDRDPEPVRQLARRRGDRPGDRQAKAFERLTRLAGRRRHGIGERAGPGNSDRAAIRRQHAQAEIAGQRARDLDHRPGGDRGRKGRIEADADSARCVLDEPDAPRFERPESRREHAADRHVGSVSEEASVGDRRDRNRRHHGRRRRRGLRRRRRRGLRRRRQVGRRRRWGRRRRRGRRRGRRRNRRWRGNRRQARGGRRRGSGSRRRSEGRRGRGSRHEGRRGRGRRHGVGASGPASARESGPASARDQPVGSPGTPGSAASAALGRRSRRHSRWCRSRFRGGRRAGARCSILRQARRPPHPRRTRSMHRPSPPRPRVRRRSVAARSRRRSPANPPL